MVNEALRQILGDKSDHTEISTLRGHFISKAVHSPQKMVVWTYLCQRLKPLCLHFKFPIDR